MQQPNARIDIGPEQVRIDADTVAKAFRITPQDLRRRLRDGTVTSRFETGAGMDEGLVRLTFYSATRRVRVLADGTGVIRSCDVGDYGPQPARTTDTAELARLDALLDAALDATFPASDPIAISLEAPRKAARGDVD